MDQANAAAPSLTSPKNSSGDDAFTPRNIQVTKRDLILLRDTLIGELQRCRALAEIFKNSTAAPSNRAAESSQQEATTTKPPPLSSRLSDYPAGGVDLDNIVTYPPRLEPFPVKPLFLDVAWNYVAYPGKAPADQPAAQPKESPATSAAAAAEPQPEAKPQRRGWFGFGRS